MKIEGPDVEAYIERLKEEDRGPFREKYEEILDDLEEDEVDSIISNRLHERRLHTDLIKAVASGFSVSTNSPGDESRFIFHSTDPLVHTAPTEADALLVRVEQRRVHFTVVVCVVGESTVKNWTSDVDSAYNAFEKKENQDRLKEQINKKEKDTGDVQYILLAPKSDLTAVPFSKLEQRVKPDKFAIWSGEVDDPSELCHRSGNNIHKDLRDIATGCFDWASEAENPVKYTAATHPLLPLEVITFQIVREKKILEDDPHPLEFNKEDFRAEYRAHLQVECEEDIKKRIVRERTSDIFELAEQIGIYSSSDTNTVRDYRVMFPGNTDDPFEARNAVEQKFRKVAIEKQKVKLAFERTKRQFPSQQSDLAEWSDDEER